MFKLLLLCALLDIVLGQGRLLSPPGRSSMWRLGFNTPVNYNDNVLSCGGLKHRWEVNKGKCGVCGDPYDQKPRSHEAGGEFAGNTISAVFSSGSLVEFTVDVVNSNGGYFEFRICANNNFSRPVSEDCLNKVILAFEDKTTKFTAIKEGLNTVIMKLPEGLECDQCVLQWKYNTGDSYGCENDISGSQVCGFGKGKMQTEYFACSDIAIYSADKVKSLHQQIKQEEATYHVISETDKSNQTNKGHSSSRTKRTPHFDRRGPTVHYLPYHGNINIHIKPLSPVQWQWQPPTPATRIRRRVHMPENQPPPMNGNMMIPGFQNMRQQMQGRNMRPGGDREVRLSFNMRRNGPPSMMFPFEEMQGPPQASMVQVEEPTVASVPQRHEMRNVMGNPMRQMPNLPMMGNLENPRLQRQFLDPLSPDFGSEVSVHKVTQTVLSRQYAPTKQCQYCPFDQCLDDQLRIDSLFPGLFDEPRTFFECRRYEKLFTVGNYDIIKEGLPECAHPRFKRQLNMMVDDDIGCCSTSPQVILPLTVDSENETFNVVQLGNDKKQFIVQGICGRTNTSACTVCAAENNFQWVLVYDPRVNTQPPVSFVPVKFPHYCRCYNYNRRRMFMG